MIPDHLHLEVLRRPLDFALHAAIVVTHETGAGLSLMDRHLQRVQGEIGPQRCGCSPADHSAGVDVDDERQ
jgi:hypothetical protein